jgi:3-oxoadipate enol-lactonase
MQLTVPVDGGYLWADDSGGSGPVLALLHPGWGDSSIWLPMLDDLARRHRVIRYDSRGFGRSPVSRAPYTQLGDLMAVLDHCGATDAMLVGHSGGASTAVSLALASARRVRSLLLLAPGVSDYPWPLEDPYFTEFEALFTAGDREGITALALRTWAAAGVGQGAEAQVRGAVDTYFRLGDQERPDPPAFARLGEIAMPTAMVIGDLDYPAEIRCAQDIAARIPGCRQISAPGADHMLPLRRPRQLCDLICRLDRREELPEKI